MMLRNPKQAIGAGLALLLAAIVPTLAQAAVGTPILEAPQRLEWPAGMATLPKPLMPSVADWNADGIPEVLCSDGSGALCLLFVKVTPNEARVTKAEPVLAMGKPLNTGGAAKPNFVDFNGDGLKDLVIEDMKGRTLRVYPNTGSKESTTLGAFLCARIGEATGTGGDGLLRLPSGADGRVAVADWDSDGKPDVVYGMFSGDLMVFRNKGVAAKPLFPASSEPIKGPNGAIMEAYGPYPCVLDVNGDGAVDLTFGLNWGCIISYLNNAPSGAPRLVERVKARKPDLSDWEPHLSPDNYAPSDFADFDGDGTLDAVFGGYSGGSLFVARGRGLGHTLERLDQALMGEGNVVLARLAQDRILRQQLLAQHVLLNYYAHWLTGPGTARPELFKGLLAHCRARPYLYGDHSISPVDYEGLPWVSAQARSTLRCLAGREPANWTAIADGLQLSPLRAAIVRDTGVVVLDNSAFWEPQLTFLHALLTSVPAAINHLQCVQSSNDLGPRLKTPDVQVDGVNVYGSGDILGRVGSSFGSEAQWNSPDWCACVAHEVNHAVDASIFPPNRPLADRKMRLLDDAAPPEVVFTYIDRAYPYPHLDWEATKAAFKQKGLWDGVEDNWRKAWDSYWKTGPGAACDVNFLRGSLGFFVESPQEAFATLANQYFASSDVMYQLALVRWKKSIRQPINQFLFFVDVYSQGTNTSRVYQTDAKGNFEWHEAKLSRDAAGHINGMQINGAWHDFTLDAEGRVTEIK